MHMHFIDWLVGFILIASLIFTVFKTKKYTKNVADFLAAGRCAGRYLLTVSEGMSGTGLVSFMVMFELFYQTGFTASWWFEILQPTLLIIAVSGWVIYRFRETRALTLAQFFEIRYSRHFRIFAGILAWFGGIITMGLFPAVSARFFIHFCGFPEIINIADFSIPTFPLVMVFIIGIPLLLTFLGQITVMITDFVQGVFVNIIIVIILAFVLFYKFNWSTLIDGITSTAPGKSMINPLDINQMKDFNIWFYLIAVFTYLYTPLANQSLQGFNSSAKTPHEAKMGKILATWRGLGWGLIMMMLPICAYTFLNHQSFFAESQEARSNLESITNTYLRHQLTVPIAMTSILPVGIMGAFAAVMFCASVSTMDTQLLSWGSIFIQDVVLPFRKNPLSLKKHMQILRLSIVFVAFFIFLFSLLYPQTKELFFFFSLTAAIFAGGAGSVIIGGLYWKHGTTLAAWVTMIISLALGIAGMICQAAIADFPINGTVMSFFIMLISILMYIVVSLLDQRQVFNLDKLLHRGQYAINEDQVSGGTSPGLLLKIFGITQEFSFGDKVIAIVSVCWGFIWFLVFLVMTVLGIVWGLDTKSWASFWHFKVMLLFFVNAIVTIILGIGGIRDLKRLLINLKKSQRNDLDNGVVRSDDVKSSLTQKECVSQRIS